MSGSVSSLPTTVLCTSPTTSLSGSTSDLCMATGFGNCGSGGGNALTGGGGATGAERNNEQPAANSAAAHTATLTACSGRPADARRAKEPWMFMDLIYSKV